MLLARPGLRRLPSGRTAAQRGRAPVTIPRDRANADHVSGSNFSGANFSGANLRYDPPTIGS